MNQAILLINCKDQKGLVTVVTEFIMKNDGNILDIDEHVDHDNNHFFMRVSWDLDGFAIGADKIGDYFDTLIAKRYSMKWKLKFSNQKSRIAIFVSQYGHCLLDILARNYNGELDVEIPLIISNHKKFEDISQKFGVEFCFIPKTTATKVEAEKKELKLLQQYNIDTIVLARYMQILSLDFCSRYKNKIINIHHSTLPAFPGANPYKSAFNRGVKIIGATAHYVTADLDEGPIIAQSVLPINHKCSINEMQLRGKDIEKLVLARALYAHVTHKTLVYKNKTIVFDDAI